MKRYPQKVPYGLPLPMGGVHSPWVSNSVTTVESKIDLTTERCAHSRKVDVSTPVSKWVLYLQDEPKGVGRLSCDLQSLAPEVPAIYLSKTPIWINLTSTRGCIVLMNQSLDTL